MACFAKAFGVVFLGEPQIEARGQAHECGWSMRVPMLVLAGGCVAIGLLAAGGGFGVVPVIAGAGWDAHCGGARRDGRAARRTGRGWFGPVFVLVVLAAGLWIIRWQLLAGRVTQTVTWDCGYARPTARMQYTASSFAQPLTGLFRTFLRTRTSFGSARRATSPHAASLSHAYARRLPRADLSAAVPRRGLGDVCGCAGFSRAGAALRAVHCR